jgi:hypothetical protein
MKQIITAILIICFLQPVCTVSAQENLKAIEGKRLHLSILARHPKLDKVYQQPDLYGGLTTSPKVTIYLPLADWDNATLKERDLLAADVSSLIKHVKANPLKYARIPTNAPAASQIKNNVVKMNNKSWQIIAGQISPDGKDILLDSTVSAGQ